MFGWFKTGLPERGPDQQWIESRMAWLVDQFGRDRMTRGPVVLPTDEFFPGPFSATPACMRRLLSLVCKYMEVDERLIDLRFYKEHRAEPLSFGPQPFGRTSAGMYEAAGDSAIVWLEVNNIEDLESVVATLAHEVGHHLLIGSGRISPDTEDHEPLTDLLTVFLGLGIFTANSVIHENYWRAGNWSGWQHGRHGYLPARLLGYGLAVFAHNRSETDPEWLGFLRLDARDAFQSAQRHLIETNSMGLSRGGPCPSYPPGAHRPSQRVEIEEDSVGPHAEDDLSADRDESDEDESVRETKSLDEQDDAFTRGVVHWNHGEYEEAVAAFSEALECDPDDGEILQHRALAHAQLGQFEFAVPDAEQCVQLDPDDLGARRVRAMVLHAAGRYDEARSDWDHILSLHPADADTYYQRGLTHFVTGDFERAVTDFDHAIRHYPRAAWFYTARAHARERLGRHELAAADREEALRRDPWSAEP
jgi:tetratricopeptide (TPR) repeat protein